MHESKSQSTASDTPENSPLKSTASEAHVTDSGATRRVGLLLVNLGTPDEPTSASVRRYLREFLSDPRVLGLSAPMRWLLLNAVILPTRPKKSAAAYRAIWTDRGSPLRIHSEALIREVAAQLGDGFEVRLGMRYGAPSIEQGIQELSSSGIHSLIVLPLFPQYTSAVTASVSAEVFRCLTKSTDIGPVDVLGAFYDEPEFAASWAAVSAAGLAAFKADHVVFSFHGLPANQVRASDPQGDHCLVAHDCCVAPGPSLTRCYRAQCYATAANLTRALDLDPADTTTSFQSRLGNTPWIEPYTDQILAGLRERGVSRLAVLCPAFVADCLETLEEVGIRLRNDWLALGGEDLWLSPCPNSDPTFVDAVTTWIRRRAPSPHP